MIEKEKSELLALLKSKAFLRGEFVLSSGKKSDFYLDARLVTLSPAGAYFAGKIILAMVRGEGVDAIGGPTLGADPLVGAIGSLSYQEGIPLNTFIIRKAPKSHGQQKRLEGPAFKEGACVVIIDDVATTGKAFIESVEVLSAMNVRIKKAICLIDREEGAREALAKYAVPLESIFTIGDFLK